MAKKTSKPETGKPETRKAARKTAAPRSTPRNISASAKSPRERIVDATMALLEDKPFEQITLREIAATAGVTLGELRGEFGSPLAILSEHVRRIDRAVLSDTDEDMAEDPARERLFEVLMRRFEAMAPYKEAVRSLTRSAMRNPGLAFTLNGFGVQSMQWMLTAADIGSSGPKGMLRAQGLALTFGAVMRTWLDDDDADMAGTMAALDRALSRAEHWSVLLDEAFRIPAGACRLASRLRTRRRRYDPYEDEQAAV